MEFVASFSGGKDSALSIKRMIERGHRLIAIIVSTKEDMNTSWTHDLDKKYFEKVADILRCEVIFTDTDVDNYEEQFENALVKSKKLGARACIFGDIDISDHLSWNKRRCDNVCMECIHPLMFEDREEIVEKFLTSGLKAKIKKIDEKKIPKDMLGINFDIEFVEKIKKIKNVDICGENGEFHTVIDLESLRKVLGADIYVDNASTCFPKAPSVSTRLSEFIDNESYSINRGTYMKAYNLSSQVIDVRDKLTKLLKAPKGYNTIFSPSATEAINMTLRGCLYKGDEIIVDDRMHNSSWRTVEYLKNKDVGVKVWCESTGEGSSSFGLIADAEEEVRKYEENCISNKEIICKSDNSNQTINKKYDIMEFKKLITNKTKVVFVTLVDNITGHYLNEAEEIGRICAEKNIYYIVDGVQSICERELDLEKLKADAFILSGHIGLMGPEGIAATVIRDDMAKDMEALIYGGTGSQSNSPNMPDTLPDKLEAGTMPTPAIIALGAAIDYVEKVGIDKIIEKKHRLGERLREGLKKIDGTEVSGNGSFCSLSMTEQDDAMVAFNIDARRRIMTRVGIQCSPCTHIVEGSFPNGSIRFTPGYFSNEYDIDEIIDAILYMESNF
ncbi:MAG: aminotransferase class V-fold PLP-dependent enzyme [Peptostreptococcus sp.]|uniref:aminotransferase class V-fold PLP-dependent enzyme n=1 Tax=Peptostreptococcus sp. TaxID=1262 RepID=UPI002FCAD55A